MPVVSPKPLGVDPVLPCHEEVDHHVAQLPFREVPEGLLHDVHGAHHEDREPDVAADVRGHDIAREFLGDRVRLHEVFR
jgi:hypothetical protein